MMRLLRPVLHAIVTEGWPTVNLKGDRQLGAWSGVIVGIAVAVPPSAKDSTVPMDYL